MTNAKMAKLQLKEKWPGVFVSGRKLFTKNLVPGKAIYGENLVTIDGTEYREWVPQRSKLAAAMINGMNAMPIAEGGKVLYLGAAEGTTVSHISDIVGSHGLVFAVELSEKSMQKLLAIAEERGNIMPILGDANKPDDYLEYVGGYKIDVQYQDISQKNQSEIFVKNAKVYLAAGKTGLLAVKARSISSVQRAAKILAQEIEQLKPFFRVNQMLSLEPFDKDHAFVLCKKY